MGVFSNISKVLGLGKDLDIDEFMTASDAEDVDVMHEAADFYVKPIALQSESDLAIVEEELNAKNIVLLNISPVSRNPANLKAFVDKLRTFVVSVNGDIARIDEDKILLTPQKVKIVKRRRA
ncbi:MAG: cell division protein SepF [Candidatus Micrarchaeia archaeon]